MARLFGTDGVRGVANGPVLNADLAYKLGRAAALYFGREVKTPKILIGRDPRLSGTMLESALAAGICSAGGNAYGMMNKLSRKILGDYSGNSIVASLSLKSPLKNREETDRKIRDFCSW